MSFDTNIKSLHLYTSLSLFLLLLVPSYGLTVDGTLLLSFKYSILSDPLSVLDNWDYNDATPCQWTGVACANVQTNLGIMPDMFRVIGLSLPNCKLGGTITEDLGFIQHLKVLDLSGNFFNGTLPISLFNASELEVLSLSNNAISGSIPEFVLGPKSLKVLNLSDNALAGSIPKSTTSLPNLSIVSLRGNSLSGPMPVGIQSSLQVLDLSSNLLNGSLPLEFGGLNLKYLNLSSNKLSGSVTKEFTSEIPGNATIDLSFNELSGEVPDSISLSNQKPEAYQGNSDLCGKPVKKLCTIPSTLSSPPNVSTNGTLTPAIAAMPNIIDQNTPVPASPGSSAQPQITQKHGLKPGAIAGIAVGDLAGIGVLAILILYIYQKKKKKAIDEEHKQVSSDPTFKAYEFKKDSQPPSVVKETRTLPTWPCLTITNGEESSEATSSDGDENGHSIPPEVENQNQPTKSRSSLVMVDGETELELETLLKASAYVLGSSGGSIVYKAVLQGGNSFAVRRIGECGVEKFKEFESHVMAIAKLRHENLVRVRGFYWGDDEKLVIYDYVCNGSLANVGYRKVGSSPYYLPYQTRFKIARGVAKGLTYIHEKKNVHGNIKPSNILLTQDMDPMISDFGLHWLINGKHVHKANASARHFGSKRSSDSSHDDVHTHDDKASPYVGPVGAGFIGCTSPYHAPESLDNLKPNPKWDVYSFGVLLLELITGKVFSDRELSQWGTGSVSEEPDRFLRMADVAIRGDVVGREDATLAWFKLGFGCASLAPSKRPCMRDVLNVLEKIGCSI